MNKRIVAISVLLLIMCAMAASVFAETYVCADPSEEVNVSWNGSTVMASYNGKSYLKFQVVVSLEDGKVETVTFQFDAIKLPQTRVQTQPASGKVVGVANCSLKKY